MGTAFTMITGYIISLFTKDDEKALRLDLISPLVYGFVPKERKAVEDNVEYCSVDKALHIITYHNAEKDKEAEANGTA